MTLDLDDRTPVGRRSQLASRVHTARRTLGTELLWWGRSTARLVRFAPGAVLVYLGAALVGRVLLGELFVAAWSLLLLLAGLVARLWPAWFDARVADPIRRRRLLRRVVGSWEEVRGGAGLPEGVLLGQRPRWVGAELVLRPVVPVGVTVEDFERVADRLAAGLRAVRLRTSSPSPGVVELTVLFVDPLAVPFEAAVAELDAAVVWDRVAIGRREDGRVWEWSVRVSTLTAGASGSGKGSLLWGLVIGLGPAVKAGVVRLYGVDLKGGMELAMGRGMFEQVAVTGEDAADLLVDISSQLRARASGLAGVTRQHKPTVESPHVLVVVDELAALVAYGDRKERERGEAALNVILSQGRAVGFTLAAFVQDPKKEVVRNRGLFPASLGLRLRGREEVAMVLGDGARAAGAACDRIPLSMPGTGYVLADGESYPVRVRAGYVTDDAIRLAVDRFGQPATHEQIALDEDEAAENKAGDEQSGDETDEAAPVAGLVNEGPPRRRGGAGRSPRASKERTRTC